MSDTPITWPITAAIRALVADSVQRANSGHPGAPMGMAEIAFVLWCKVMRHNPCNPTWFNRDRFIMSNGHASMLLYSMLHLTGYDISIDDLMRFRQLHSKTPGHPEYGLTPGVETTTGPLGQGFANAVGMAIASRTLAAQFNRPQYNIIDNNIWVTVGDGCIMEGISHESASLAGKLALANLKVIYDDNKITIDGNMDGWCTDDTPKRFESYGWHVIRDINGHNVDQAFHALNQATTIKDKPVLICAKTIIGKGAPQKAGTSSVHGAALGLAEIERLRSEINWPHEPFVIPPEIYAEYNQRSRGQALEQSWNTKFAAYQSEYPSLAKELQRRITNNILPDLHTALDSAINDANNHKRPLSTRKANQEALNLMAPMFPEILGGSADLQGSNLTKYPGSTPINEDPKGNTIHYGVREFAMTAIANGIALHRGFLPFTATFLTFADYARNAIRLSALMGLRIMHIYTHDSIGVGEDGPTHQPIEHIWSLRLIPQLDVWRPFDLAEVLTSWKSLCKNNANPIALILSRQDLPIVSTIRNPDDISRGGYILRDFPQATNPSRQLVIIATGSEVHLAVKAADNLESRGIGVRVVSMPCLELFERQDAAYRKLVLPSMPTLIVEAGSAGGWWRYAGADGAVLSIDRFGESAPGDQLYEYFGFTICNIERLAESLLRP